MQQPMYKSVMRFRAQAALPHTWYMGPSRKPGVRPYIAATYAKFTICQPGKAALPHTWCMGPSRNPGVRPLKSASWPRAKTWTHAGAHTHVVHRPHSSLVCLHPEMDARM
eukprot:scaffold173174_cov21-Tisochrysis_lutea.AAC.1